MQVAACHVFFFSRFFRIRNEIHDRVHQYSCENSSRLACKLVSHARDCLEEIQGNSSAGVRSQLGGHDQTDLISACCHGCHRSAAALRYTLDFMHNHILTYQVNFLLSIVLLALDELFPFPFPFPTVTLWQRIPWTALTRRVPCWMRRTTWPSTPTTMTCASRRRVASRAMCRTF
jgi:hypothetical protein